VKFRPLTITGTVVFIAGYGDDVFPNGIDRAYGLVFVIDSFPVPDDAVIRPMATGEAYQDKGRQEMIWYFHNIYF
jgi:hypothetical protein